MRTHARLVFWSRMRRLTFLLLALWLAGNLLLPWFARDLSRFSMFGFPAGFWLVAQGALLAYLAIIVVFSVIVDRMERKYRLASSDDSAAAADPGP